MKRVAIIGSHGIYANYGGWDQLVNNLAEQKSKDIQYIIHNSRDTPDFKVNLKNITVIKSFFKASGFEGLFFDFFSVLRSYFFVDTILFLGIQGLPLVPFLKIFKKINIVCNSGGIEWERKKFGYFARIYLRFCFKLSLKYARHVILDNAYFNKYLPPKAEFKSDIHIIPYGGFIDFTLSPNLDILAIYNFLNNIYFLSVSRSIPDNMINELCSSFKKSDQHLVLVSNLSKSTYGKSILKRFSNNKNITLIDGLYNKPYLDLIRRNCYAYIHTHTKCGTAPSLVEMIIAKKPIISIDLPQNRYTLGNEGFYFNFYPELLNEISSIKNINEYKISKKIYSRYYWVNVVSSYEDLF